nr:glycoside hydrolase family 43 protein [uncultured Carboxylicivirga sp.]
MKKFIWGLSALMMFAWIGCSDKGSDPTPGPEPDPDYVIPDYADDYSAISSWEYRGQWNLANVHDPSVAYYNGYYYMYLTDASYGNAHEGHGHFQGKRSKDLVNWNWVGGPFYNPPTWVADSLNAIRSRMDLAPIAEADIQYGYWAPVVRKVNVGGKEILRMYYSVIIDNYIKTGNPTSANFDGSWTERAFIGMCESTDPAGAQWIDKGFVTCSSSDKGTDYTRSAYNSWNDAYFYYNAIDPTYIVTPEGSHYLIYGSWHSGIALLQLDETTGKPINDLGEPYADNAEDLAARYGKHIATRISSGYWTRWQGSEGPEIMYNEDTGYYYLFMAYGTLAVDYNTRVCRSKNIEGPYLDFYGHDVANGYADGNKGCYPVVTHPYQFNNHSGWVGFSHNAVFQNESTGDWFYASQARLPEGTNGNPYANAIMMGHVHKIRWTEDGWPVIMPERYTAAPQETITEDELVGSWEHITLKFERSVMQKSVSLTLSANHQASGAITGTWSYDSAKKILTIGDTKLCVEREADWEAEPRVLTIVYSGLTNDGVTYWGKKVE